MLDITNLCMDCFYGTLLLLPKRFYVLDLLYICSNESFFKIIFKFQHNSLQKIFLYVVRDKHDSKNEIISLVFVILAYIDARIFVINSH